VAIACKKRLLYRGVNSFHIPPPVGFCRRHVQFHSMKYLLVLLLMFPCMALADSVPLYDNGHVAAIEAHMWSGHGGFIVDTGASYNGLPVFIIDMERQEGNMHPLLDAHHKPVFMTAYLANGYKELDPIFVAREIRIGNCVFVNTLWTPSLLPTIGLNTLNKMPHWHFSLSDGLFDFDCP
jgi:hypothetical protein